MRLKRQNLRVSGFTSECSHFVNAVLCDDVLWFEHETIGTCVQKALKNSLAMFWSKENSLARRHLCRYNFKLKH